MNHLTDEQIRKLLRGGHDTRKVYAAYKAAVEHKGQPTVILAKTVKGYGLGEAGEGRNISHQQKKMNEKELREFRERFNIPISDDVIAETPFYRPPPDSPETKYLLERRKALGGFLPGAHRQAGDARRAEAGCISPNFSKARRIRSLHDDGVRAVAEHVAAATRASANTSCRSFPTKRARSAWTRCSARSAFIRPKGQLYEPVDSKSLLYYHEAKDGQILEEGITEAGSMSSFIAAGTSYATHGVHMIPFYIYYSMFGLQRIGDLMWLAGDIKAKGFLLGATAGRTTLNGEGLQHQDGHSLLLASTIPTLLTYDPAFAYEIAVIIADGMRRMYRGRRGHFLLPHALQRKLSDAADARRRRGGHSQRASTNSSPARKAKSIKAHIFGSGPIINQALRAQEILAERYGVSRRCLERDELQTAPQRRDLSCQRWNMLHPTAAAEEILRRNVCWRKSRARSWPCRTTCASCPTRLRRGFRAD